MAFVVLKTKSITLNSRIDMQVKMKHFLPGSFPICDKHIYTVARYVRMFDGRCNFLGNFEQVAGKIWGQIRQIWKMFAWNYHCMTGIYRLNCHEPNANIVRIHFAYRVASLKDLAKYAILCTCIQQYFTSIFKCLTRKSPTGDFLTPSQPAPPAQPPDNGTLWGGWAGGAGWLGTFDRLKTRSSSIPTQPALHGCIDWHVR